jgi:hypothetical protein
MVHRLLLKRPKTDDARLGCSPARSTVIQALTRARAAARLLAQAALPVATAVERSAWLP